MCGGPRVVVDDLAVANAGREKPHLVRAKALLSQRATWNVVTAVASFATLASVATVALFGLLAHFGPVAGVVSTIFVTAPLALAAYAFFRTRRVVGALRAAMEDAEVALTQELLRVRGALDGAEIARSLAVSVAHAEELLARAQVDRFLDDGAARKNVRVAEESVSAPDSSPARRRVR